MEFMFGKAVHIICNTFTILSQKSVGEHDQKMIQLLTESFVLKCEVILIFFILKVALSYSHPGVVKI